MQYKAIVIGVSLGGMNAMKVLFASLPSTFSIPIIIVQHIGARSDNMWINFINTTSNLKLKEVREKEKVELGNVYVAPANYHLLVEMDETFSLTIDQRVNFARPSIDVLFESAAAAYKDKLIGIILTGSNKDGAAGVKRIQEYGGLVVVEDPETAESNTMPLAAIATTKPDHILPLKKIVDLLIQLEQNNLAS
ncbi:chemotaxis protein CheB [Aurantibacillus circumpalustris]|uniref:chemotaxis protein CheB n=1 Tax=Aurantibacillus circumpalustris TaxID=3036359 RepID=UPI00295AE864|nr:chemotaxis protein CheB [Aurantibacillus circumpalustris]